MISSALKNGHVPDGTYPKISAHFGVLAQAVGKAWRQMKLKVDRYLNENEGNKENLPMFLFETGQLWKEACA